VYTSGKKSPNGVDSARPYEPEKNPAIRRLNAGAIKRRKGKTLFPVATAYDAQVYNTTTGAFTGGANYVTSTENIPVYTQTDGTSANASANVTFKRVTTVSPTTLTYLAKLSSLNIVQFTVTVSYVFHGQTYSMSMTTLRGPD